MIFFISVFINLIKLYFLGTTQEDVKEPAIYLHKLEQLKLCNLSYIREYERSSKASCIATSYSFKYLREVKFLISVVKSFTVVLKLCNLSQVYLNSLR